MIEKAPAASTAAAAVGHSSAVSENANAHGVYHGVCVGYKAEHKDEYLREFPRLLAMRDKRDRMLRAIPTFATSAVAAFLKDLEAFEEFMRSLTEVKWDSYAHNVVATQGKNIALDAFLSGSAYTVTGPFMGLIGAVGYSAVAAADTMLSHAGWTEGGTTNAPTYTAPRKTIGWSAASAGAKAPSSAPVYAMTGTGTVKGVFLCFGTTPTTAVSTIDSTAGALWSAGLFSGGDQAVVNTNTVTVTYSTSL